MQPALWQPQAALSIQALSLSRGGALHCAQSPGVCMGLTRSRPKQGGAPQALLPSQPQNRTDWVPKVKIYLSVPLQPAYLAMGTLSLMDQYNPLTKLHGRLQLKLVCEV